MYGLSPIAKELRDQLPTEESYVHTIQKTTFAEKDTSPGSNAIIVDRPTTHHATHNS